MATERRAVLRKAMVLKDGRRVAEVAMDTANPGDVRIRIRSHRWLQAHFDTVDPSVQTEYIDYVIRQIRNDRVSVALQFQWHEWLLSSLTHYPFEQYQLTNYYYMTDAMNQLNWVRRAFGRVQTCLRSARCPW